MVKTKKGGYSLIEVVVAITVLGLTTLWMVPAFTNSIRLNAQSEKRFQAQLKVAAKVEELMATGYNGTEIEDGDVHVIPMQHDEYNVEVRIGEAENPIFAVRTYVPRSESESGDP